MVVETLIYTLAIKSVAVVSGFTAAFITSRLVEAKGVLVTSIRTNVTLVNIDASRLVFALFVIIFITKTKIISQFKTLIRKFVLTEMFLYTYPLLQTHRKVSLSAMQMLLGTHDA